MTKKNMDSVVELKGVVVEYRSKGSRSQEFRALDNVDLEIYKGETVGFIGNNGAGKSTTLRVILGLQVYVSGLVSLNGKPPSKSESRRGVSYVPESPYLYDYLTPLELLYLGIKMHQRWGDKPDIELKAYCSSWLKRFGLDDAANRRIRTFSKGMSQRTALAHALACNPEFLILDEPLSGLDPIGRKEVVAILDEYRSSGRTLFFSSHVLNDVEQLADRFVFIHKGRIQAVHSTSEILATEDPRFVVVIEGGGLDGFERISSRLWKREINKGDLGKIVNSILANNGKSGISLHSVQNRNSLDRAYETFVKDLR